MYLEEGPNDKDSHDNTFKKNQENDRLLYIL